ncbi:MAG: 23S rRNA (adenine(2503)-C(2))-methyltransferase RlmN [Candidatus Riflebacteria bacterium]|nr:23S rRNA (adenine(2503)-C(2))-methyltransferase RlmN [Candidatus Riflebacteria bacterium]
MPTNYLLALNRDEFAGEITALGLEPFRAKQIWEWIFSKGIFSFDEMKNLPIIAREKLAARFPQILPPIEDKQCDPDGTIKIAITLGDGSRIEAVALPDDETGSLTFCISSQVGCPVKCSFCRTGTMGFKRNLTTEEIVLQVLALSREMQSKPTNIVFMGMGEPFLNRHALFAAIDILTSPKGMGMASRRLTISTSGIREGILELAERPGEVNLAVSLHAADNDTRSRLMPVNKKCPVERLREAVQDYISRTNRRVTFEIILLKGINDGPEHIINLIEFCQGLTCHINLVRFNPYPGCLYKPASATAEKEFRKALKKAEIAVTVRKSRGGEILAACGQLANEPSSQENAPPTET